MAPFFVAVDNPAGPVVLSWRDDRADPSGPGAHVAGS